MGFDCTLHSVDEKLIRNQFAKAVLSGKIPKRGVVAEAELDEGYWQSAFDALKGDSPEAAAETVCQLALVFAAKKFPYHYERGFALSLWPEMDGELAAELPNELTESPEVLFGTLVKEYPELQGKFPTDFDGNWSTGRFIPAKKIKKALTWIQKRVEKIEEGERVGLTRFGGHLGGGGRVHG